MHNWDLDTGYSNLFSLQPTHNPLTAIQTAPMEDSVSNQLQDTYVQESFRMEG